MFFKNFTPLKLRSDRPVSVDFLAERLAQQRFVPCSNSMLASSGFVPPVEEPGLSPEDQRYALEVKAHDGETFVLISLRLETRLLPASVIKKAFLERLLELERTMGRPLRGRAKKEVKEEVIRSLIPKAFTRQSDIRAVFALKSGWLFVDSSSPSKTDAFISRLVGALDMAPMRLPKPKLPLSSAMQAWLLAGEAPEGFTVDRECELKGMNAATIRYTHLDLDNEEVRRHVRDGKAPQQVALTYADRLSFVITHKMVFKKVGLNLSGASQEARDGMTPIDAENAEKGSSSHEQNIDEASLALAADILLLGSAFVLCSNALIGALGGEDPEADKEATQDEADAAVEREAREKAMNNVANSFSGEPITDPAVDADPLYEQAVAVVRAQGCASISFVQRHFMMGYNRAARLVERMEIEGVVTPLDKAGVRQVIN